MLLANCSVYEVLVPSSSNVPLLIDTCVPAYGWPLGLAAAASTYSVAPSAKVIAPALVAAMTSPPVARRLPTLVQAATACPQDMGTPDAPAVAWFCTTIPEHPAPVGAQPAGIDVATEALVSMQLAPARAISVGHPSIAALNAAKFALTWAADAVLPSVKVWGRVTA